MEQPQGRPRHRPAPPGLGLRRLQDPLERPAELSASAVLQSYFSGRAYEEVGSVRGRSRYAASYVHQPGYLTPPTRANYYFSGRGSLPDPVDLPDGPLLQLRLQARRPQPVREARGDQRVQPAEGGHHGQPVLRRLDRDVGQPRRLPERRRERPLPAVQPVHHRRRSKGSTGSAGRTSARRSTRSATRRRGPTASPSACGSRRRQRQANDGRAAPRGRPFSFLWRSRGAQWSRLRKASTASGKRKT